MKSIFIALILLTGIISCKKSMPHRELSWTGFTFYIPPPEFNLDSMPPGILFHMGYYLHISDAGESHLITRKGYDSKRELYSIEISDSIKEVLFNLASDSTIFKTEDHHSEGMIYCGYEYLLSFKTGTLVRQIEYIPPSANAKLKSLHNLFDQLRQHSRIISTTLIDTTALDKAIYKQIKYSTPLPLKAEVKFTPPEIKPDKE